MPATARSTRPALTLPAKSPSARDLGCSGVASTAPRASRSKKTTNRLDDGLRPCVASLRRRQAPAGHTNLLCHIFTSRLFESLFPRCGKSEVLILTTSELILRCKRSERQPLDVISRGLGIDNLVGSRPGSLKMPSPAKWRVFFTGIEDCDIIRAWHPTGSMGLLMCLSWLALSREMRRTAGNRRLDLERGFCASGEGLYVQSHAGEPICLRRSRWRT